MTPAAVHERALADWLEAEAQVETRRRAALAASARAAERARDAEMLARAGRSDPFAIGVGDAARALAARAEAERRRLDEAVRAEALLRARFVAARAALAGAADLPPERASCG